jgi:replicative DNA helicase
MNEDFFTPSVSKIIRGLRRVYLTHKKCPTVRQLIDIIIPKICKDDESQIEECIDTIQEAEYCELPTKTDEFYDWLQDETQRFIKRSTLEHALVKCVELMEKDKIDEAIDLITKANNVSFDDDLGHDYWEDAEERMEFLKNPGTIIDTGLPTLNRAIGGGWRNKSLVVIGAATNVGKTLILGHITHNLVEQGYNGLYITLEINEHILANRIDANMSDIGMSELDDDVDTLMNRILEKKKTRDQLVASEPDRYKPYGRLIIKEYPPSTLNSNQIISFVRELQLKRNNFKPDFICVDYIGLMGPNGKVFSDNTYGKLKTVSEELRAVACMMNIPVFTAVQVNRDGYDSSYVGLSKTADSIGIPQTADLMIMVCRDQEADSSNIMYWNVAKSRTSKNGAQFTTTVDYEHMRIVDDDINNRANQSEEAAIKAARALSELRKRKQEESNAST